MSTKELALETIRDLPEDTTWQQIEKRIQFLAAIESARQDVRNGKVTPHEEVRELVDSWISQ